MFKIVVFGIGNSLRGDDGVGVEVVKRLQARYDHPDVSLILCHQLNPEFADVILESQVAIFVDADCSLIPGQWILKKMDAKESSTPINFHAMLPEDLMTLASSLSDNDCKALLVGIGPEQFEQPDVLSPSVASVIDDLVGQLISQLQGYLTTNIE